MQIGKMRSYELIYETLFYSCILATLELRRWDSYQLNISTISDHENIYRKANRAAECVALLRHKIQTC